MENAPAQPQFTRLLTNKVLTRLERMRLNPTRRLTNRTHGEHLSGKGGSSTEFTDYRDYVAGDDVRFVDWNIFSRLNRPYLKLYRHEEEMHVVVIVDASTSMMFENKFDLARSLAASFGVMTLMNLERLSVYSCNHVGAEPKLLPPCTGRASMRRMFAFLEEIEGGGDFPIEEAVETVLHRHRGRGIAVLLSDFSTFGDVQRSLNLLFSAGLEIFALQILSPAELDPELTGDIRLIDAETGHTLDVSSVGELLGIYHQHRLTQEEQLATWCRQRSGRFLALDSREPLESILFDRLRRQGWVR